MSAPTPIPVMAHTFSVAGRRMQVSVGLWSRMTGPLPPEGYACDGCSMSPDSWRRFKLWPACVVHDYHYREGVVSRADADAALRQNLRELVLAQGGSRSEAERIAWIYWGRVRIWGASSYSMASEEREPSFWERLKRTWGG